MTTINPNNLRFCYEVETNLSNVSGNNVNYKIPWANSANIVKVYDTSPSNSWSTNGITYTIPFPGIWIFTLSTPFITSNGSITYNYFIDIKINSYYYTREGIVKFDDATNFRDFRTVMHQCNEGDTISTDFLFNGDSTNSVSLQNTTQGGVYSRFTGILITPY